MSTINITNARKDLYKLVEAVNAFHEPTLIVGKKANAVLISEDDWSAIQETLYLDAIPGMTKSILEGANEELEDCISEEIAKLLASYSDKYFVSVELGLQTVNEKTHQEINQNITNDEFKKAIVLLKKYVDIKKEDDYVEEQLDYLV